MRRIQATKIIKAAALIFLIATIAAVILFPKQILNLRAALETMGWEAMVLFVLAYILLTVALMPMTALNITGGILFGPVTGLILNIFAGAIGAQAAFIVSRKLAQSKMHSLVENRFLRFKRLLQAERFEQVLMLRLMPVLPFNLLNWGFGVTKVSGKDHFFATLIGILPAVTIYTVAAGLFGEIILEEGLSGLGPEQELLIVITLVMLGLLAALPLFIKRKREML